MISWRKLPVILCPENSQREWLLGWVGALITSVASWCCISLRAWYKCLLDLGVSHHSSYTLQDSVCSLQVFYMSEHVLKGLSWPVLLLLMLTSLIFGARTCSCFLRDLKKLLSMVVTSLVEPASKPVCACILFWIFIRYLILLIDTDLFRWFIFYVWVFA